LPTCGRLPRDAANAVETKQAELRTEPKITVGRLGNQFVENLPMNGRSFSSLIDLTPGVVLTPSNFTEQGQCSVNGQRPDAN
jgi:hypothetical protein